MPPDTPYRIAGTARSGSRHLDPSLINAASSRVIDATTTSGSVTVRGG